MTKVTRTTSRIGWIATGALVALVLAAWVDGGEQPLREISEPVILQGAGE